MPEDQVSALQLHLFASDSQAYQDALARYEELRPILKQERTLAQHSREIPSRPISITVRLKLS